MSRRTLRLGAVLLCGLFGLLVQAVPAAVPAAAQGTAGQGTAGGATPAAVPSGGTIQEIRIDGAQRVDPETVRSYMHINLGDPFDPIKLDDSLKSLYETGLFADVTLARQGDTLVVKVVENPVINRIAFEGNKRIEDKDLEGEIELRPRVVFTRTKVQNDVQRILDLYRRKGRFNATVEPKIIKLDQNRVDLVFEINEGEITQISAINFVGNQAFSDGTLRGQLATTESSWWRFWSSSDVYDPDRLAFDRENLRRFYLSEGYADFRVVSTVAELSPDRSSFIVTFTVDEGPRYKFGKIDINSTLKNLDPETLRDDVKTQEGDWYDATLVDKSIDALTEAVGNLGYAFVDIRPKTQRDRKNLTIGLTYDINEGPKVYVERIDIEGNVRTLDRVIRREFRLAEGDAFNAAKLRRSRERIQNLEFFQKVEVTNEPGSAPDKTVVKVKVQEASTGEVSLGAGVSTSVGPLARIQIRERNLLGRGQDLRLGFQLSGISSQVDLSFTEPYFMGRDLSAGFDLFRNTLQGNESNFDQKRLGGALRAGYNVTEYTRNVWRYQLERRTIYNVGDSASFAVKSEEGTTVRSSIDQELIWDRTVGGANPTSGFQVSYETNFTGLGGDVRFLRNELKGNYYYPIGDSFTLFIGGAAGHMVGIGQDTRVSDRFFLGGSTFRGFEFGGIGPRDISSDDAIGGKQYYKGTAELRFPLGFQDALDVQGRIFADAGAVWGFDGDKGSAYDSDSPRLAIGPGLVWNSPLGLVAIDFGFPLIKEGFDKTQLLNFSFGVQF
ncbi:outer membrane protein assembly factor BamA [Tistlia consotensis]|uniref:outer membrane protein assembly factor BamA n=1 Tax=Tistlia consotensis TaxID=1321365 RepID=UPI001F47A022|nr:outer membrane protein assembly factor BamA [Tistlia consotensis]